MNTRVRNILVVALFLGGSLGVSLGGCAGLVGEDMPLEGSEDPRNAGGSGGTSSTGGAGGETTGTGGSETGGSTGTTGTTTTTTTGGGSTGTGGATGTGGTTGTGGATGGSGGATGGSGGATGGTGGVPPTVDAGGGAGGSTGGTGGATGGTGGATGGTGGATGGAAGSGGATGGTAGTGGATGGTGGATGGTGGTGGTAGTGGTGGGTGMCSLAVTVTTASAGGQFAPKNVGAIWIANSSGTFVKTIAKWAAQRQNWLTAWNAASKGNVVDVVSTATSNTHVTHKATWNCTDVNKAVVADGAFRVYFEMTDKDGTGPNTFAAFTKGTTAATVTPADTANFKSVSLVFTP